MNDEIKETINSLLLATTLPNGVSFKLDKEKINQLKANVTNLQQENESNINRIHELEQEIDSEYIQKEYYKSRCEKASEYINRNKQKTIYAYGDNEDDDFEICLWEEDIDYLLNILQNGSDSQC